MNTAPRFAYRHHPCLLDALDVRCKLICTCLLSVSLIRASWSFLGLISIMVVILMLQSGLNPWQTLKQIKYFLVLLAVVFVFRAVTLSGDTSGMLPSLHFSRRGAVEGTLVVWRFFLVMLLGILFSTTTRPSHLKAAVQWLLAPVPFIPEKRAGIMVSLFLRFLPMMVDQVRQVSLAQRARCGHLERNPVKRVMRPALPLLKKMVHSADDLALGMTARCYSEDRTEPPLNPWQIEFFVLAATLALAALAYI